MNAPTDWVSAIAILAAGLIIGAIVFFIVRRKPSTIDTNLERKDLEAKRDALIAQLRALPDDAVDERARLENDTANVLRSLDAGGGQAVLPVPASVVDDRRDRHATTAMSPTIKGFLWGAGSFAALAALGYFVMQSATPRDQGAGPMGAQPTSTIAPAQQPPDPVVQQLEAAVQKDPNNLALRNDLAQAYLEHDNLMAVFDQTKFVLEKSPDDSRALTFQALVRMAMGEGAASTKMLQQALKSDPKNLDAWVALAWVHAQNNDMKGAENAIAEAVRVSPGDKARLEDVLQQMKTHAAQPAAQPTEAQMASGELPAGHPAIDGATPQMPMQAAAAAPAGAAGANSIRVTLSLDPNATTRNGVLFVMARSPQGGPPIAVKRLLPTSFPMTIDLGSADSMMGQPLPASFRLEARLDSDGDAATKLPTDPRAVMENVTPGAVVTLALK
jgi:cytochrome c-type biogenesis protein CcmH